MTAPNPLVAEREDSTTPVTGIGIVESALDLHRGVESGSWVEGGLGLAGTGLEALGLALDPVGTLLASGTGWLIEHVQPLSDVLDQLAGDPDAITAHAATWRAVADAVGRAATNLAAGVVGADAWSGPAADAYRARVAELVEHLTATGTGAATVASVVEGAGVLVGVVRELVRDLVADCVATLVARIPLWLAEEGLTLGLATPHVVAQASSLVARWAARIADLVTALVRSLGNLAPLLRRLDEVFTAARDGLRAPADPPGLPPMLRRPVDDPTAPAPRTGDGDAPPGSDRAPAPPVSTPPRTADPAPPSATPPRAADPPTPAPTPPAVATPGAQTASTPSASIPSAPAPHGPAPTATPTPPAAAVPARVPRNADAPAAPPRTTTPSAAPASPASPGRVSRVLDGGTDPGPGGGPPPPAIPQPLRRADPLPTTPLLDHYVGEADPTNPDRAFHPSTVEYMSPEELESQRVYSSGHELRWAHDGSLVDTTSARTAHSGGGRAMFVLDEHGNLYVSEEQIVGRLHHSSFLGGRPVAGAGELVVEEGRLVVVSRKSGHYQPGPEQEQAVRTALAEQGVHVDDVIFEAGF